MIPGLGKSPGEGIGYPLRFSWASLVAQLVKDLPAMRVDLGSISGLGRSPGDGKVNPLQSSGREFHGLYRPWGHKKSDTTKWLSLYMY